MMFFKKTKFGVYIQKDKKDNRVVSSIGKGKFKKK